MALKLKEDRTFATVLSDGAIHITVPEGTEGAKIRTYETSDGKTGSKTELVYKEISGIISKVDIRDGDFGSQLQLTIEDGDAEPIVLSLATASNFGEDVMKKLPNVDLSLPVTIIPYSFVDGKGKNKKGVTIVQNEKKLQNYFYDFHKKVNINGYPEPKKVKPTKANPEGKLSKDQWKAYFMDARLFLIDFITEKFNLGATEMDADELDAFDLTNKEE